MATYTQDNGSVASTQRDYFLSKVPLDTDFVIFRTSTTHTLVFGDYENGKFNNSTVITVPRSQFDGSNSQVRTTHETTTTVNLPYEYYSYSNIGYGTEVFPTAYTKHNNYVNSLTSSVLLVFLLAFVGFSIIKKRWLI